MYYQKHYEQLIQNAIVRSSDRLDGYFELHHIIPECVGGSNNVANLVMLTPKEHFIAHMLLAKMYSGTPVGYKLASAFNMMCNNDNHQRRYHNSRSFDIARKLYSDNHPCKQEHVKDKIRVSLQKAREEGRRTDGPRAPRKTTCCECGCGESFEQRVTESKRFIDGHATHFRYLDINERIKQSERLSVFLSHLSTEQKLNRMQAALGCDQIERGKAISAGKKGKSTNQREIEIETYGKMSEEEFKTHIQGRTPAICTRMTNRRKLYNANNYI